MKNHEPLWRITESVRLQEQIKNKPLDAPDKKILLLVLSINIVVILAMMAGVYFVVRWLF